MTCITYNNFLLKHWWLLSPVSWCCWFRVLNYAVATYLLVVGILGVLHFWYGHTIRPQAVAALVAGILILVKPAILNYVVGIYLIFTGVMESA